MNHIPHAKELTTVGGETSALYRLARDAYRYAFPLAYMARLRYSQMVNGDFTGRKFQLNQFEHFNRVVTPESSIGLPQTDTLYSSGWFHVGLEPLLLQIPKVENRYWSVQMCDFFGITFALPNRRNLPDGGLVAIVGPEFQGELPPEVVQVYRPSMPWLFMAIRMHFVSEEDRPVAHGLQVQFEMTPLSVFQGGKAVQNPETYEPYLPLDRAQDPLADFKLLQHMWVECPPPAYDKAVHTKFLALGLNGDIHQGFDHLTAQDRADLERAEADGFKEILDAARKFPGEPTANGWLQVRKDIGLYDTQDYHYRNLIAHMGTIATPVSENIYMMLQTEPSGALLSAGKSYQLHYAKDKLPEVGAFWSLHAYRYQGFTVIPNRLNRYAINNRSQGLHYDADGSLTIYLQANDPGGEKSANWLPIELAPGEPFLLLTRAYEPLGAILALQWPGPELLVAAS